MGEVQRQFGSTTRQHCGGTTGREQPIVDTGTQQQPDGAREEDTAVPAASIAAEAFDRAYAGTPPWDVAGPQPAFIGLAEAGCLGGKVLDIGCGTGELALDLAERAASVLSTDRSAIRIGKARAKATARDLPARFVVADATAPGELGETFATVVASGLLHVLSDPGRHALAAGLRTAIRSGGLYHVLCFNEHAAAGMGPRLVAQVELRDLFTDG